MESVYTIMSTEETYLFSLRCCFFFLKAFLTLRSKKAARSIVRLGLALSPLDILPSVPPSTLNKHKFTLLNYHSAFVICLEDWTITITITITIIEGNKGGEKLTFLQRIYSWVAVDKIAPKEMIFIGSSK